MRLVSGIMFSFIHTRSVVLMRSTSPFHSQCHSDTDGLPEWESGLHHTLSKRALKKYYMYNISYYSIPMCQIIPISSRSIPEWSIFSPSKVRIMQKQNRKWELRGGGEVREKQEESEKVNVHPYTRTLILNADWVQDVGAHRQGQKERLRGPAVNG